MSSPQNLPRLIADIGGTNARFALVHPDGTLSAEHTLACADHATPIAAIRDYLARCNEPHPSQAALAVATPVTGDQITFTNNQRWSFSIEKARQELALKQLIVLNDFTALALALPHLANQERYQLGGDAPVAGATIGLLGPGTGLGVSGLVWSGNHWLPLQTEGGHATATPVTDKEWAVLAVLKEKFGRHVSLERLLSGPGLVNIYQALRKLDGKPEDILEPADITERGVADSCPYCAKTLAMFCAMLGTAAGNLALTVGARGGVYIGGGIAPRLIDFLKRSDLRARFEDKGRMMDYLTPIPLWVITADNPAFRGVAAAFDL